MNFDTVDDDQLLELLSQAIDQTDPPPAELAEVAVRALSWDFGFERMVEAESQGQPVLLRRSEAVIAGPVDLAFTLAGHELDVTIDGGRITGMVIPEGANLVAISPGHEPEPVATDDFGRFELETERVSVALAIDTADGSRMRTPLLDLG